ncbi:hypothetical protein VKT23_019417 [Stygiomarasmius scandens]|uniref:Uncharacterized protein n=1 Tax=Marasmiellus scandens TaxID=2682957 RepID=A0ABR1ILF2_9AGAR
MRLTNEQDVVGPPDALENEPTVLLGASTGVLSNTSRIGGVGGFKSYVDCTVNSTVAPHRTPRRYKAYL